MSMRKTVLTLTAPLILAAACTQGDHPGDELSLTPAIDVDQGCLGEITPMTFTQTSVKVSAKVECINGGKLKFAICVRRRLIQSVGSQLWGLVWFPIGSAKEAVADEVVGVEDCVEVPEQQYENPPPGTSFSFDLAADVFCGELGQRYLYTSSLKSVRAFHPWTNFFLGDDWHTLASGPRVTRICGATF